jgi:hypothetical protein
MEQNQPTQNTSLFQLNLDANNSFTLRSAASWAKVLAILGLIFGILFIAIGFLVQNAMKTNTYSGYGDMDTRGNANIIENMGTAGMVIYIFFGVLVIVGSVFALNFGNKISAALRTNDQNALRTGFGAVRNYFAYWSILMIIGLLLMIIGIAAGGSSMRM